jgi:YHS domain-containing protein
MSKLRSPWWLASALTTATLVVGCAEEPAATPPPAPSTTAAPAPKTDDIKPAPVSDKKDDAPKGDMPKGDAPKLEGPKADTSKSAALKLTDKEIAAIKELPADEAALALAQGLCPIGGDHLGAMGKPFKVSAEGKTLFLCCDGCEADFKKDPKAALAKVSAK